MPGRVRVVLVKAWSSDAPDSGIDHDSKPVDNVDPLFGMPDDHRLTEDEFRMAMRPTALEMRTLLGITSGTNVPRNASTIARNILEKAVFAYPKTEPTPEPQGTVVYAVQLSDGSALPAEVAQLPGTGAVVAEPRRLDGKRSPTGEN